MNTVNPLIFLVPVIALLIIIILYFNFLKRVQNKTALTRLVIILSILAFSLNFAWEIIQLPLYQNNSFDLRHVSFCAVASLADVIMVLLIYFVLGKIYKSPFWIKDITFDKALFLIFTGGMGAVLSEMKHLSEADWSYSSSMPVVPLIHVGLSPLLQFMLLPLLIYYVSFSLLNQFVKCNGNKNLKYL